MLDSSTSILINDIELRAGDPLWRYRALRVAGTSFGEQPPAGVIDEVARKLAENHAEAVDDAPASTVAARLIETPGCYDQTELVNYQAMQVDSVETEVLHRVVITDLKEQRKFIFVEDPVATARDAIEPITVLEQHLGVTILQAGI
jgi:hypothetical protein